MEMIKNCSILTTRGQTPNMRRIPRRQKAADFCVLMIPFHPAGY